MYALNTRGTPLARPPCAHSRHSSLSACVSLCRAAGTKTHTARGAKQHFARRDRAGTITLYTLNEKQKLIFSIRASLIIRDKIYSSIASPNPPPQNVLSLSFSLSLALCVDRLWRRCAIAICRSISRRRHKVITNQIEPGSAFAKFSPTPPPALRHFRSVCLFVCV